MRVSMISARNESYQAYYRAGYSLENVKASIRYALEHGVYVSLNLLYFPGFNDRPEELGAWKDFFREQPVQMIQIRNLNLDPDYFLKIMPTENGKPLGVQTFLHELRETFPTMVIGSFSHFVK